MTADRARIVSPVHLPDGSLAPDGAKIIFTLTGWDKNATSIILGGASEAVVESGAIDTYTHRVGSGDRQSAIIVTSSYFNSTSRRWVTEHLGTIAPNGPGPFDLADLLAIPAPVPTVPDALAQALGAAAAADADATQTAADRVQTGLDAAYAAAVLADISLAHDIYATKSEGIAATSSGQYFYVKQASDGSADLYLNSAGTAVSQNITQKLGESASAVNAVQLASSSVVVGAMPVTPIIDINFAALAGTDGRFVAGQGATVSRDMVPLSSGHMLGLLSAGTATEYYATGPSGVQSAQRLQMSIAAVYDIFKNVVIPAGPYTVKVKAKSNAGQGTANFKFGVLSGGGSMAAAATTEAGWTTLTTTVTPNGTSDQPRVAIQNDSGAAIDILIDEIQWYPADESIPAYTAQITPLLRDGLSYSGALPRSGFAIDTRTKTVRGFVPFSTFPLRKTFSAITMMALVKTDESTNVATKVLSLDGTEGTASIGTNVGLAYGAPALPRLTTNPAHWMPGTGWHVMTLRIKAGEQSFWIDKFKHAVAAAASPVIPVKSGLMVGNDDGATTGREFKGLYSQIAVWDQWLTDAQVRTAYGVLAARHAISSLPAIATDCVWIGEGDSITYNIATGVDGPGFMAQYAKSATKRQEILCQNNAVSGSQLSHLTTRLTSTYLTDRIAQAVAAGYRVVVTVLIGANGVPTIAALETYWNALKTAGARVVACTVLPREDAGDGGTAFNASRNALNVQIRASSVPNAVADLAATASIGADGAATAGVYYTADKIHPNYAGHTIMLGIIQPVVEAQRLA